jgi:hypothetical protein
MNKIVGWKDNYPIYIICVVEDLSNVNNSINNIKEICEESKINFNVREYDSRKYSSDRDNIIKFPAFHIYIKKSYNGTLYLDKPIAEHINICVSKYLQKKNKKSWFSWFF